MVARCSTSGSGILSGRPSCIIRRMSRRWSITCGLAGRRCPGRAQLAHMFSSEIEEILALLTTAARSGSAIVSVLSNFPAGRGSEPQRCRASV